jgi:hypothetical protein
MGRRDGGTVKSSEGGSGCCTDYGRGRGSVAESVQSWYDDGRYSHGKSWGMLLICRVRPQRLGGAGTAWPDRVSGVEGRGG